VCSLRLRQIGELLCSVLKVGFCTVLPSLAIIGIRLYAAGKAIHVARVDLGKILENACLALTSGMQLAYHAKLGLNAASQR
jgi:hypothetical protein